MFALRPDRSLRPERVSGKSTGASDEGRILTYRASRHDNARSRLGSSKRKTLPHKLPEGSELMPLPPTFAAEQTSVPAWLPPLAEGRTLWLAYPFVHDAQSAR